MAACAGGVTPPVNQAPVVVTAIGNLTFTAGQRVSYNVASNFSDPDGQPLSFSIGGLSSVPVSIVGNAGEISGTFSNTVGSPFSVTVIAADPSNLTARSVFTITVNPATVVVPPTPGTFAITGVTTVSCRTISAGQRNLTFTPQYTGLSGSPVSFSVVNELTPTTNAGPYTLQVYTDNPTITLKAVQTGTVNEANFTYNWLAACNANGRAGATEPGTALRVRVLGNPVEGKTAEVEISGVAGQAVDMELTDL